MLYLRRREFITVLGGTAVAWPLAARAQQPERLRRIGILMPYPPTDAENRSRVEATRQELQRLGWRPGANIEFDERWTTNNMDLIRANAANLVELKPDVIVASGGRVIPVLLQITREIPIVVPGTVDPIGTGWVKSLARPGGNITGFTLMEFSIFGKLLDLLKQLARTLSALGLCSIPIIRTVSCSGARSQHLPAGLGSSPSFSRSTGSTISIAPLLRSPSVPIRRSFSCPT